MKGMSTKKMKYLVEFNVHGISSKLNFIKYTILEESKIRIKNKAKFIVCFLPWNCRNNLQSYQIFN